MPWPHVIFDLDGTLADTIGAIVASYQHAHRTVLGEELTEADVRPWIGRTLLDTYREISPERADELFRTYVDFNLANLATLQRDYPGIRELLADLRTAGCSVSIATAKRREAAELTLRIARLEDLVDGLTTPEDTDRHKPAPDPVLHALARVGGEPADAVYVGDALPDVRAARAAGVAAVAVTWGAGDPQALRAEGPDAVCDTVDELRGVLLPGPGRPSALR